MAQDDIQGQVVDAQGNPVDGAIVELTKSYQSSPLDEQVVRRTTTDANGNYIFEFHPDGDGTTQEWHVSCYNHDGTAYVNSFNNPGVTADLPSNVIPDSQTWQSISSADEQICQNFWNDNWTFGSTDPNDTSNNSFVQNRFGAINAIDVFVQENTNDRAFYSTTAFNLSSFTNLQVYGQGREDNNNIDNQELEIRIDGNLEFASSVPGWQEININVSGFSGNLEIELGYRNNRGSGESGTYSEFILS